MANELTPAEILVRVIELAKSLPSDPSNYGELSSRKRREMRTALEEAVTNLGKVTETLDSVRQPRLVFDPTNPATIAKLVADTLLLQDRQPLSQAVEQPFYGAGVYAIYYRGKFPAYRPIRNLDHPIYVGKADPAEIHAATAMDQGTRLHVRLKDHERSISRAENLDLLDFECRYLVVRSAWIETAEDLLISWFHPVWNNETKVCYGFGKHGDSAETRKNERSPWDTLHPGRAWATSNLNTPNKRKAEEISRNIARHFATYPPRRHS